MNNDFSDNLDYSSGLASLFHRHAAGSARRRGLAYCQKCEERTEQEYVRRDVRSEVYRCRSCGMSNNIAVR